MVNTDNLVKGKGNAKATPTVSDEAVAVTFPKAYSDIIGSRCSFLINLKLISVKCDGVPAYYPKDIAEVLEQKKIEILDSMTRIDSKNQI